MNHQRLAVLIASLSITACGGGGGGGGDTTLPPLSAALPITASNAVAATKASYEAALGSSELTDLGGSLGLTAGTPGSSAKASREARVSGFLVDVMQKIPFGPDVFPCAVAGSVTLSGDIANPLTLTAGDSFAVESTACDDGLGEVVDGLLSLTVVSFSGDVVTGLYALTMDAVVDDLQIVSADDTITSNGDVSVSLNTMSTSSVLTSVSGDSITTDSNAAAQTLRAYLSEQTMQSGGIEPLYTLVAAGTLDTTSLDGVIDYSTPLRFEVVADNYPHVGEMLVEGNNSSAHLITVDDVDVRIEIDSDGNGSVDETINTTWAELEGG